MKTTKRAYTMRLNGTTDDWQDALWETHETINCGVKLFGEWLLTFRGGVSPDLQYENLAELKTEEKIRATKRRQRVILALSWLSVESIDGAPAKKYWVKHKHDKKSDYRSDWKVPAALKEILKKRGVKVKEIAEWWVGGHFQP